MDTQPLIDAVKDFLAAHNMAPTTFGRLAMRDPHFVRDLESGQRRMFTQTEERVRRFIAEYQPAAEPTDTEDAAEPEKARAA
jgi:hypothetical protein